jgi:hypothetical protein
MGQLFKSLNPILALSLESFSGISEQLMAGLAVIVKTSWPIFAGPRSELLLELLSRTAMLVPASRYAFQVAEYAISDLPDTSGSFVSSENFGDCVDLLISFASMSSGSRFNVSASGSQTVTEEDGNAETPRALKEYCFL